MSGICGIVRLDGGEVEAAEMDALLAALAHRGPDGTRQWRTGEVALGHALLATTPEAAVERLPLTDAASGCTITADARLDNREELMAALGLGEDGRVIGDGELILRAYLAWGDECPARLLGDFAFAIWDQREGRLYCARDHMGMRQFNYCHLPGQMLVISTEDAGVLAHPAVPRALDGGQIADFLADREDVDFTSTFFERVKRLPPAHSLTVADGDCSLRRYWSLEPVEPLRLESDEAYVDAFVGVFAKAVAARLRRHGRVGSMLSGGADSTSVAIVAAEILARAGADRLTTISAVSADPSSCPETGSIEAVLATDRFDPLRVRLADVAARSESLIDALEKAPNPFELNGTMLRSIYACAAEHGIKVVLDGGSGDVILTSGNRAAALLVAGRFGAALREVRSQASFLPPAERLRHIVTRLLGAAWVAFAPLPLREWLRDKRITTAVPLANPDFLARIDFPARRKRAAAHLRTVRHDDPQWRIQSLLHPNLVSGRERFDQLAAPFGVECRDPFMDLRVIRLCLSLPVDQLHANGWPKVILRRLLLRHLPRSIAWRSDKSHLGWAFTTALLNQRPELTHLPDEGKSRLSAYVSPCALAALSGAQGNAPTDMSTRLLALDRFLRRYGNDGSGN